MDDPGPAALEPSLRQRFERIQLALFGVAVATLAVELVAHAATGEPQLAQAATITGLFVATQALVAIGPLRRGDVSTAAAWTCLALLAVSAAVAVIMPSITHAYVVTPIVAIAIGISFIDRSVMRPLMGLAWLTVLAMALVAETQPQLESVPAWLLNVLRVGGLVLSTGVVIGLVALFVDRLREVATGLRATNQRLQETEEELRNANEDLRQQVVELERQGTELTLLTDLGGMLESSESMEEVRTVSAAVLEPLFEGDAGVLYLASDAPGTLEAAANWGPLPDHEPVISASDCWALRRGRTYAVSEGGPEPRCRHISDIETVAGVVCVPLIAQAETIGLLHVRVTRRGRRGRWASQLEERSRLATVAAEHTALALANVRLRTVLRDQSVRDHLTGLFNRRYLDESLRRELQRATRTASPVGILILDIDHFKQLNDAHGHAVGDAVLATLGQYLKANVRADDIPCRYGGEEFLVVMPAATLQDAQRRAEALRRGIAGLRLGEIASDLKQATVSVGVAAHPPHGPDPDVLLYRADAALYRAKAAGRNRVNVASTRPPVPIEIRPGVEPQVEASRDAAPP